MTRIALITTTINVPEVLYDVHAYVPENCSLDVVVAGDAKTPPRARALVEDELGGTYLGVDGPEVERWRVHSLIGVNSIQRRNLALLHALTLGPDLVVTIDDDNEPYDAPDYLASFVDGFHRDATRVTSSSTGWYNPAHVLDPPVVHRGYPLDQRHSRGTYSTSSVPVTMAGGRYPPRVGVVAGLWFGDPDVDAIERLVNDPTVIGFRSGSGPRDVILNVGTWAPFNTQNTAFTWEVAPLMQCLVGVGRYDDIWASYVARVVMDAHGWYVRYGYPIAMQRRNEHDLLRDLEAEYLGYLRTPDLVDELRRVSVDSSLGELDVLKALGVVYRRVKFALPPTTRTTNEAWLLDAREAVDEGSKLRAERSK